jgi:WhiB family redox-sensing transcriptional regulator
VWGGEIFDRGAIVAYKRGRGRPRKSDPTEVAA